MELSGTWCLHRTADAKLKRQQAESVFGVPTMVLSENSGATPTPDSAERVIAAADSNGTTMHRPPLREWSGISAVLPGIYFSTTLNTRLQVAGFYSDNGVVGSYFMNKAYNYGALHQNNGNISSIVDNKDSSRTQTFTYDF